MMEEKTCHDVEGKVKDVLSIMDFVKIGDYTESEDAVHFSIDMMWQEKALLDELGELHGMNKDAAAKELCDILLTEICLKIMPQFLTIIADHVPATDFAGKGDELMSVFENLSANFLSGSDWALSGPDLTALAEMYAGAPEEKKEIAMFMHRMRWNGSLPTFFTVGQGDLRVACGNGPIGEIGVRFIKRSEGYASCAFSLALSKNSSVRHCTWIDKF